MPHMPNWEYAGKVGQDKPIHDVVEVYDGFYGKYKDIAPGTKPGKVHDQIPAPFKVGGK